MSAPLWQQSGEVAEILAEIDAADGEVTPELAARLDRAIPSLEAKVAAILGHVRDYDARAEAADAEIKRLTAYRDGQRRQARHWKRYVLHHMLTAGISSLDCAHMGRPRVCPGKPSVQVDDVDALPPGFVKTTTAPQKALIKRALDAGEDVPGARLSEGDPYLRID